MYHNILTAIAFDNEHNPTGSIEVARALAAPDGRITLLHVLEEIPPYVLSYVPADYTAAARTAVAGTLEDMAAGIPNATGVVVDGHSGRTILEYAEEHGCDLIILDSHRPGMQDLLIGSTATHVVRHAPCAVHVLR